MFLFSLFFPNHQRLSTPHPIIHCTIKMAWGAFEHITVIFTAITCVISVADIALRLWKWWNGPGPCQTCEGQREVELNQQVAHLQNQIRQALERERARNTILADLERGNQATEGDGTELEDL